MGKIVNPFIAGAPVTEQRMFFGRNDIFQWIENSLAGQFADHILVVHGQRRVGKTSVLKQLGNRLPKRYIPVFFDLQGRTHTTLDHFLWWLARETVRVLKQDRDIEIPPPQKEAFASDPEYFENQFLTSVRSSLGKNTLLLTFDEFDNLEESEVKEELARPLVDHLRRLMGQPNLNFIFSIGSSGRKLENMQAAYTDFFKTALYKKISFLNEEQTHNLVTRPVEGIIDYERAAVDRIYRITSGHPYFTQLTCHELFARCQRTEQRKISVSDVESVLDDVVERGTVNLKFVWDEASDIEKWSLTALAQLDKADNRALADYLRKNRVRFSESDLNSGLLHLREKDVITSQNRFVIHLLRIWLQKNRPIEQTREELTEANPIANRFIEIGLEFRDGGQHEKAIEFFRQALSVSADNIQAQVNIALTYAAQGQLEQAIAEFEKALTIDDEDVASRSGLCDAHLALGDAAMKKGRTKDAVLSYQRVLAINAEHLEARGRMAELSRQRAEKALTDGKDEEALSAFAEALKFTPEDQSLIMRSEKVRAEKNAKVLAEQLARSEKEAAARNWDKAITALNDALEIAPGDESILKKIQTIQEKQLRERLDGLLAKVEAAEKAGRWDTAISTLNEYLQLKPEDAAIQKRIANLVEAKHAAWLKGVMARVDQAVAAQNWDEALTALNEALRLEPENAEMQAKAKKVREARRIAELNAMLKRADQAVAAERWDEAINILNDGLASDPDNETLKTKLAEARKAKREAHLQAALRLADSAAQAGKWEAAVASLNEVLANEPDNTEFQRKLAEVRAQEHQSRWEAARSEAESLREAERFEEALQVWQSYLALYPDDRERVDGETKPITQESELFELYGNAEGAIAERDFDKAIPLLKEIIIRDEDYKDASRLLTNAIESRRTGTTQKLGKPHKKPAKIRAQGEPKTGNRRIWVIGGLLAILILGIGGGVFWFGKNGWPAMPSFFTKNSATITPTHIPGPTSTTTPDPRVKSVRNQHLYLFVKSEKTWHDARDYCAAQGGYLATLQDAAENEMVANLLAGNAWLGATDEVEEGTWVWVSGEPWGYTNWNKDSNQPDNDQGQEHYLEFEMRRGSHRPSDWNDKPGEEKNYFVCEWEPGLTAQTQISPKDGMTMVYIPAGEFEMGSDISSSNEEPVHTVYLDTFWIDQTEVTNKMYSLCVSAGICQPPKAVNSYSRTSYYDNSDFENYPVIYVDWEMANTYCTWAGRRLPTEAEWEKAARGTTGYNFPWGDEMNCDKANGMSCIGETTPVGQYTLGKSPFGALDLAGNVMEWVADWYSATYYASSPRENPAGPSSGSTHVLRGGSWKSNENSIRSSYRFGLNPDMTNFYVIGFRCALGETSDTNTIISTPNPTPKASATPDARILNPANQHSYLYVKLNKRWEEAQDYCAARGGYLVTIQDEAENIYIFMMTLGKTWLGATDKEEEGTWVWVSGEPWEYRNWDGYVQPDNYGSGEDYLSFAHVNDGQRFESGWSDMPNGDRYFVCEWEPIP
ncbi:MAG: tetratricopeptide repeat protein [Anaerolineaceae bacterium]|nr:MAG: tetratricopeptide repeat protein [Anaerolineaceae bacterium]